MIVVLREQKPERTINAKSVTFKVILKTNVSYKLTQKRIYAVAVVQLAIWHQNVMLISGLVISVNKNEI